MIETKEKQIAQIQYAYRQWTKLGNECTALSMRRDIAERTYRELLAITGLTESEAIPLEP